VSQTAKFERERAKRLYAAIMSCQRGTAYQTEYRNLGERPLGQCWYEWADQMSREIAEGVDRALETGKQVIQ
jgi:hypothetical protein